MLDKGVICADLFRGSDLEEVSLGNAKGARVNEVVNGKWSLISFLNLSNVRMLASWLGCFRNSVSQERKGYHIYHW